VPNRVAIGRLYENLMCAQCSGYDADAVAGIGLRAGIPTLTAVRGIDAIKAQNKTLRA
jgi:hypothetical protein